MTTIPVMAFVQQLCYELPENGLNAPVSQLCLHPSRVLVLFALEQSFSFEPDCRLSDGNYWRNRLRQLPL